MATRLTGRDRISVLFKRYRWVLLMIVAVVLLALFVPSIRSIPVAI